MQAHTILEVCNASLAGLLAVIPVCACSSDCPLNEVGISASADGVRAAGLTLTLAQQSQLSLSNARP
jgi:hypothetical protein